MMQVSDRLEANAIIDRLVADGDTFSPGDAARLIGLIPAKKRRTPFSFSWLSRGSGNSATGHAAGVGDVKIENESSEQHLDLNTLPEHRIGGYVVTHEPGTIEITLMWADTVQDQNGQVCRLEYDAATGRPRAMRLSRQRTIRLFMVLAHYVDFVPWKLPMTV